MNHKNYHHGPLSHSEVVKGEIHNVLSIIKADPHYSSNCRFSSELYHPSVALSQILSPLISSLRELNEHLTLGELNRIKCNAATSASSAGYIDAITYLTPFCTAISSCDVSAPITGAALSALHKFILYGLIDPSSVQDAKEGITIIARSIQHCSFKESGSEIKSNANFNGNEKTSIQITDEEVVLKLLNLASLVIRSPSGILLDSADIMGIFDTCLHVATRVRDKASGLLQNAAVDCLSSMVLVVFRTAPNVSVDFNFSAKNVQSMGERENDSSSEGSDDLWGGSDPTKQESEVHDSFYDTSKNIQQDDECFASSSTKLLRTPLTFEEGQQDVQNGQTYSAHFAIMSCLASLVNPLTNSDQTCATALQLINIALETAPSDLLVGSSQLLNILKNTLCKNLLYLSTTSDLVVLSRTLRVIFNLFNSIKHQLKLQLEVFLKSVHLRILDRITRDELVGKFQASVEFEKEISLAEIALESLLEFCNEPALMQDIYVNYDCDVQFTNLFENIFQILASVATGSKISDDKQGFATYEKVECKESEDSNGEEKIEFLNIIRPQQPLNVLNMLACEGILAVIDSIARRCEVPSHEDVKHSTASIDVENSNKISAFAANLALSDTESDSLESSGVNMSSPPSTASGSLEWLDEARQQTSKVFSERKRKKHQLASVATKFNKKPFDKEWIQKAEQLGIFSEPATAQSVAKFLYRTPNLDKTQIGLYLSKGPPEKYPFHSDVMHKFVALFDFSGMTFSYALREFLKRFRLPGEAQCIDRLMDTFAVRLYRQQCDAYSDVKYIEDNANEDKPSLSPKLMNSREVIDKIDSHLEDGDAASKFSNNERQQDIPLFRNSDAAFVLAFSTIMLNTDLHNPRIKDERRMTLEQFIRNNRGTNDGHDFPVQFMTELYHQIKTQEIQVRKDLSDVIDDEIGCVDHIGLLLSTSKEGVTPFFTSHDEASFITRQAGIHERDMFLSIVHYALQAMSFIFVHSSDDSLVIKLLKGFKQIATICVYFQLDGTFNQVLRILIKYGKDYISNNISLSHCGYGAEEVLDIKEYDLKIGKTTGNESQQSMKLPFSTLLASNLHYLNNNSSFNSDVVVGSAEYKGPLSLYCALLLVKSNLMLVREAWPNLIECIFALRDASALPPSVADLDDFADSAGDILPPSSFALQCQKRANKYILSMSHENLLCESKVRWPFFSLFSKTRHVNNSLDTNSMDRDMSLGINGGTSLEHVGKNTNKDISSFSLNLLVVTETSKIDEVFIGKKERIPTTRIIRTLLDETFKEDRIQVDTVTTLTHNSSCKELIFEHHAVFALEMAARSLFSNKEHALELFPIFVSKFEAILQMNTNSTNDQNLHNPFLIERVMVTVLRSCIHLIGLPEMRPNLIFSLTKLIQLPPPILYHVSDRLACGMAIILRCSYSELRQVDEWATVGDLLDCCAQYESGRRFVFDGIASCIEDGLPEPYHNGKVSKTCDTGTIIYEGVSMFARLLLKFVFGSYHGDLSFSFLAIPCLEKVYWYLFHMTREIGVDDKAIPDEDLWRSVCSAFYSVGLCKEPTSALHAMECLERLIVSTDVEAVSDIGWLSLLESITSKQPLVSLEASRVKAFHLLCRTFLSVLSHMLRSEKNWGALSEIVSLLAAHASENLRADRNGHGPLFESTIETLTNTINVMSMLEFPAGSDLTNGLIETLSQELEKVGAVGGLTKMIVATTKKTVVVKDG